MEQPIHQLLMPAKVIYGPDALRELGGAASAYGTKALLISDPVMLNNGVVQRCVSLLEAASMTCDVYADVVTEPTHLYVEDALAICREHGCDVVVAAGGGSCLDTAKAVAVMMRNDGFIGDYRHRRFERAALPLIAVPTTGGTGSEMTKVTVITDTRTDEKLMISQPELLPCVALVDPLLTVSCPPHITAATGIDALSHAIEAYLSKKAHPATDALALSAARHITANLPEAYRNGASVPARTEMMIGSMLAGAAFSNASVALVHGMSRPIGALFHVPHGISNAMLLPAVLEYSLPEAASRLAGIGQAMLPELIGKGLTDRQLAEAAIGRIKEWCVLMNIPNLCGWGIERERYESLLGKMADDAIASGSPANHPKPVTREEIIRLYMLIYDYEFKH